MGLKKEIGIRLLFVVAMSFVMLIWIASKPATNLPPKEVPAIPVEVVAYKPSSELQHVIDYYDQWATEQIASNVAPGAAVAIVKDGHIVHAKGYGLRSTKTTDSINEETVFRIASVSKGFASVMAGMMVEDHLLDWQGKVSGYLPDFNLRDTLNSKELTISHLLSHTTGLPRHAYTDLIESGSKYDDMKQSIQELPLIGPVGKYYSYQNVIYSLFSDIAIAVTEEPYEQLMHEKIFGPVGMENASVSYDSINNHKNVALPHVKTTSGWRPTKISKTYYNVIPAAGVNASVNDMANWLITLMGNKPDVIGQQTLDKLFSPIIQTPRRKYLRNWPGLKSAYYGLGWRIFNYGDNERKIVYHGGYVNHYRAEIAFDQEDNIGIVVLTNAPTKMANKSIPTFFEEYYKKYSSMNQ